MVRIQEVKRENRAGTEHRCRVPVEAQELSEVFEKPVLRAITETDANSVITRKVDDEYPLSFGGKGTAFSRVPEVHDQSKTLEGHALEKTVCPDLDLARLGWSGHGQLTRRT